MMPGSVPQTTKVAVAVDYRTVPGGPFLRYSGGRYTVKGALRLSSPLLGALASPAHHFPALLASEACACFHATVAVSLNPLATDQ